MLHGWFRTMHFLQLLWIRLSILGTMPPEAEVISSNLPFSIHWSQNLWKKSVPRHKSAQSLVALNCSAVRCSGEAPSLGGA